jgi:hypothetical protein
MGAKPIGVSPKLWNGLPTICAVPFNAQLPIRLGDCAPNRKNDFALAALALLDDSAAQKRMVNE